MSTDNQSSDPFWTDTNKLIYKKCMKLAEEAGARLSQSMVENKAKLPKCGFVICHEAAKWSDLWNRYSKKKVTEEQVKFCFHLGFVPEYI